MGRKRGTKPRADGQELDMRRCRAGRAGNIPRSSCGQRLRRRKSGGCAEKDRVLTWGGLASWLKGRRGDTERGVSSGHSSCLYGAKGQRNRRGCPLILGDGLSQMFAPAKLADTVQRVKPDARRQRETKSGGLETSNFRRRAEVHLCDSTSTISTARCGPA